MQKPKSIVENQAIGMSRGGRTTKIHAVVDGLSNPLRFLLTGGHISRFTSSSTIACTTCTGRWIADKAYGAKHLRDYIDAEQGSYIIPPKSNTKEKWDCDYHVYCERRLTENLFNQLKNCWCLATRYDKSA
ncbi:Transposase [Lacticaseibacillus paracasei]|nr:Transposase [Lacticaseibacillus paracasei]